MLTSPPPLPAPCGDESSVALVRPVAPGAQLPHWPSDALLAGGDEALIVHGDQIYRLRRTGTGKLILTK